MRSFVQRYLPRQYYAPIRRVQYGLPARAASIIRPVIWHHYGAQSVPSSEPSARRIVANGADPSGAIAIPKRIWIYWEQPDKPEIVAALCADVTRKNPDHEVISLTAENAADYVPEYASWVGNLAPQLKADLLRLYLVARFGGIWMDSSIFLGESLGWLHEWVAESRLDFVGFRNEAIEAGSWPMVENWFFAAPAQHPFIERWLTYLQPLADGDQDALFSHLMLREECRLAAQRVPNPRWRLAYLANQAAFADAVPYRMGLLRARDEAFSFAEKYARHTWDLAMNWVVRERPERPPVLVKMTQRDRSIITAYDRAGLTHPDSLIGQVLAGYRQDDPV